MTASDRRDCKAERDGWRETIASAEPLTPEELEEVLVELDREADRDGQVWEIVDDRWQEQAGCRVHGHVGVTRWLDD